MKKVLTIALSISILFCMVVLSGCKNSQSTSTKVPKPLTAKEISSKLKDAKLPIGNIIVYTEATDTNKLLGRPNQYISKVNFADTRYEQPDADNPVGGSIETFNNTTDLKARKTYIENIIKSSPMFTEYMVVNGKYLLRLNRDLTTDQVNKYKEVFMTIK